MPDVIENALAVSRIFDATREKVFAAWTSPDALRRWYKLADDWEVPVAEVDLRVGGEYRIGMKPPGRDTFYESGTYREIIANERLVYTNVMVGAAEAEHDGTIVTVTFEDHPDGGTLVSVTETGFPSPQVRDVHAGGWPHFLAHLAEAVDA